MVPEGVDRGSLSGREGAECSLRPRVQLFHEKVGNFAFVDMFCLESGHIPAPLPT